MAVMGMNSFKAPGLDGFQAFFFKQFWPVVGDGVWRVVHEAFLGAALDPSWLRL